jgi:hypothetical protein
MFKVEPGSKVKLDAVDASYKGKHEDRRSSVTESQHPVRPYSKAPSDCSKLNAAAQRLFLVVIHYSYDGFIAKAQRSHAGRLSVAMENPVR